MSDGRPPSADASDSTIARAPARAPAAPDAPDAPGRGDAGHADAATVRVRAARAGDVPAIFENIGYWASRNRMLVRPMQDVFENLRDWFVAEVVREDGTRRFAGNGALHVLWGDIAEIRGLAVAPDVRARGVGRSLVAACEAEARRIGIPTLFAWTYEVGFFEACGFHLIDKSRDLHPRVWSECLRCPFFVGCNENGVVKPVAGVAAPADLPEPPPTAVPPGVR